MIKVDLSDSSRIQATLNMLMRLGDRIARKMADEAYQHARDFIPVRTGRLLRSLRIERHGNEYHVIAGSRIAYYAPFVEFGTRPHIIRPRRARVLRFEVRGKVVYARIVHHPGSRPVRYMGHALDRTLTELDYIIADYLNILA